MDGIRMINAGSLPNIPWQEKPENLKTKKEKKEA